MVHPWPHLTSEERDRLRSLTVRLVASSRWEAAQGFELSEAMTVTIAAHAAVLLLGLPDDSFDGVSSVIVHPNTVWLPGPRPIGGGLLTDAPLPISGQTDHHGPLLLCWDAVWAESLHPHWGEHVVYHEFAHRLDALDGSFDGAPPLPTAAHHERWVEVCTPIYEALRRGEPHEALRPYGGMSPGEFFTVTTELFFTQPAALEAREPALYDTFAGYYGQRPRW